MAIGGIGFKPMALWANASRQILKDPLHLAGVLNKSNFIFLSSLIGWSFDGLILISVSPPVILVC